MRFTLILSLFVICFNSLGQSFHDILNYQGKYYLMDRNPTGESNPYEDGLSYWYGCEYIIEDDSLKVSEILKVNKLYKDSVGLIKIGDFHPISGEINLVEILNYKRTKKEVSRKGVFYSVMSDYWAGDYWELIYKYSLSFENGILKNGSKIYNNQFHEGNSGFIQFNQESDMDYVFNIYSLDLKDSLIFEITSDEFYYTISNLIGFPVGNYRVEILDKYKINTIFRSDIFIKNNYLIQIRPDESLSNVVYNNSQVKSDTYLNNDLNYYKNKLFYGNNNIYQNDSIEVNQFSWSSYWGNERFLDVVNNISLNYNVGGGYSFSLIHPVKSPYTFEKTKLNNYSYLYGSIDFGLRLYFSKHKKVNQNRRFLEIGANYNLPVVFRNVQRFERTKISYNRLTNFKDLSVYSIIGITNGIGLSIDYRLFDTVKNNFPQLPKIQVGFTIQVDN